MAQPNISANAALPQADERAAANQATLCCLQLLNAAVDLLPSGRSSAGAVAAAVAATARVGEFLRFHAREIDVNHHDSPDLITSSLLCTALRLDMSSPPGSTLIVPIIFQMQAQTVEINQCDSSGRNALRILGRRFTQPDITDHSCHRALQLIDTLVSNPNLDVIADGVAGDSAMLNFLIPSAGTMSPLWRATSLAIFDRLLSHRSCVVDKPSRHRDRKTLLHWVLTIPAGTAESNEYLVGLARLLIQHGASIEARCDPEVRGTTPLMLAVKQGIPAMVELLIRSGADVNKLDSMQVSALDLAAAHVNASQASGARATLAALVREGLPMGLNVQQARPRLRDVAAADVDGLVEEYAQHLRESRRWLEDYLIPDLAREVTRFSHGPNAIARAPAPACSPSLRVN